MAAQSKVPNKNSATMAMRVKVLSKRLRSVPNEPNNLGQENTDKTNRNGKGGTAEDGHVLLNRNPWIWTL